MQYILSIDQSTSCTKAMIFDPDGGLLFRHDLPHKQITNSLGYVEHDAEEIYLNVKGAVAGVLKKSGIPAEEMAAVGISNQRETVVAWNVRNGRPICNAIVWQCGRAASLCREISDMAEMVRDTTGLNLSPYFAGPKMAWILRNVPGAKELQQQGNLRFGTIDTWLVYKLTGGKEYRTDYSNASRTELLNIRTLDWDDGMLELFGLKRSSLPQIVSSDSVFGMTDFEGLLPRPIPVCGVMGDSHAALFGNGCTKPGMAKVTLGTGSSVMLNVGEQMVTPKQGVVASLAWGLKGRVQYVLEGNINYAGATVKWLVDDVRLLQSSKESGTLSAGIDSTNGVYLVPAFSGLGAPYWNSDARAILCGMSRATKKEHIVRAAEESIAYQIRDVVEAMNASYEKPLEHIFADGGPTKDRFLMRFLADMLHVPIQVSGIEELSGAGAAYMAACSAQMSSMERLLSKRIIKNFSPLMAETERARLYEGWKTAVSMLLR